MGVCPEAYYYQELPDQALMELMEAQRKVMTPNPNHPAFGDPRRSLKRGAHEVGRPLV